jgi:hypothetical protein
MKFKGSKRKKVKKVKKKKAKGKKYDETFNIYGGDTNKNK